MQEAGTLQRWRWVEAGQSAPAGEAGTALARRLGVHPLVGLLLVRRGLGDEAEARRFLAPRLTDLHDPSLLPGADRAAARLHQAVKQRRPIVIYGDYDVDGITASAILWHTLRLMDADVRTYVPHRIDEGYGLNCQAVEQIAAQMPTGPDGGMIISVDCGITAVEPAAAARDKGVDLVITDHHEFDPSRLPPAHTIVHPRLPGLAYPFAWLCGAGVAFKVAWQLAKLHCGTEKLPVNFRGLLLDMMSLAALGTVADVAPLVGENRLITAHGLGQIKRTSFAGLNALIDAAKLRDEKIDAYHVGFVLGPRLNACGRMGHAADALKLLTDAAGAEAAGIAEMLTKVNEDRRAVEREIFEQARAIVVERGYDRPDCRAIVVAAEGWHEGVLGIVASRLVEMFHRPAVMISTDNGQAHGSARSVPGVSIHDALTACAAHLEKFGGHAMAAGLHLKTCDIENFRAALVEAVNAKLSADDLCPTVRIDAACALPDVDATLVEQLQRLAPFGRENPQPVLLVRGVRIVQGPSRMGAGGKHLSLVVSDGKASLRCVAFGKGDLAESFSRGSRVDLAYEPRISEWQGRRRVELHVKDLRAAERA